MGELTKKLALSVLLIIIGIFIGLDLASSGIHRLQDAPVSSFSEHQIAVHPDDERSEAVQTLDLISAIEKIDSDAELDQISPHAASSQYDRSEPLVDKLAMKTGRLVQITFQHGIEWLISLYDKLMDGS